MERNDFLGIKMIINRNKVCEIAYALRFQKISKSDISFYFDTPLLQEQRRIVLIIILLIYI